MTTANPTAPACPQVVAVVGAAAPVASLLLAHLAAALPDCWFVTFAEQPLRWPVPRVSSYRIDRSRSRETFSIADIPDMLQHRAWDLVAESRRITMADIADFLDREAVDSLIHLGSHYAGPNPEQFLNDTHRWLQAARISGVRRFVYLSDSRVYGVRPDCPVPITERTAANPLPSHQIMRDAEPDTESHGSLSIAVLRSAMVVGPNGSNPAAHDFFQTHLSSARLPNLPLQFLHEHDLARAAETAVTQNIAGLYNLAGDGSVSLREVMTLCASRHRRAGLRARFRRPALPQAKPAARNAVKYPTILTNTKFKQDGRFRFKYSSYRAVRAYCHSVLLEPG